MASSQGAYTRSAITSDWSFNRWYKIFSPRWDIPISYTSGKASATRTATLSGSFTTAFHSAAMYRDGLPRYGRTSLAIAVL